MDLKIYMGAELLHPGFYLTAMEIPIEKLVPNPRPMRSDMRLSREFVGDIRREGIHTPLMVRPLKGKDEGLFEIVTGMRRYESALKVGLKALPCIVKELSNEQAYFETVRENIHREDVNPADLADFFRRGNVEMGLSVEKMTGSLSKDKSEIKTWLWIADAPDIMTRLRERRMSKEHAFEIVKALDEIAKFRQVGRLKPEAAQRLRINIINYASRTTVPNTRRFISNQLREYRKDTGTQTSIVEVVEELSPHDRAVERLSADFASKGALVEKVSLHSDLVVRLSPELKKKYGCDYLWVEVVDTSPPTQEKIKKLLQILGANWRIMVYDLKNDTETIYPEEAQALQ